MLPFLFRVLRRHSTLSPHSAPYPSRTHNCGSLSAADVGSRVTLAGWLLPERKGKNISFFPLRDSYGTTQLIVNHSEPQSVQLADVPIESTVSVEGTVLLRPANAKRPGPTGDIDVQVENFTLLNPAKDLPFVPSNPHNLPNDDLRAQFRYLDLRRTSMSTNLKRRSKVTHLVRNVLNDQGFTEVETPVLLSSSPEGAREFIVPTRLATCESAPKFYALQQSPQQPKQLLICSGAVDKYYQIAKCFRDEDGRKDRQPEFTQIDLEMAFVSWGASSVDDWKIGGAEVRDVTEGLIREIWHQLEGIKLPDKFRVMTYAEAMASYGSDKPDTRFGLQIKDITGYLPAQEQAALTASNELLECFVVRKSQDPQFVPASRNMELEPTVGKITFDSDNGNSWLSQANVLHGSVRGKGTTLSELNAKLELEVGDDIYVSRRSKKFNGGSTSLGRSRLRLSELSQESGHFIITKEPHFLWITEFPLFTRDDGEKDFLAKGRWSSSHHPFTAPVWEDINALYNGDIELVRGQHYDLVLNGVEIGGGSVRVHDAAMQDFIFTTILKLSDQEKAPFGHLLHALQCGAPPHGGIALGLDRMMAMLCSSHSIRDVIAFPKTSAGTDLLFKSPAFVRAEVLEQYGISTRRK